MSDRSGRAVRYVEIGWVVKDRAGREFLAGSVPAADSDMLLPSGHTGRVLQDTALRFSRNAGEPVAIDSMTGFVLAKPNSPTVACGFEPLLARKRPPRVLVPSPEEQRLTDLYRTKGLEAVMSELKKFYSCSSVTLRAHRVRSSITPTAGRAFFALSDVTDRSRHSAAKTTMKFGAFPLSSRAAKFVLVREINDCLLGRLLC